MFILEALGDNVSLPFPASGSLLHSLASGSLYHLQSQHLQVFLWLWIPLPISTSVDPVGFTWIIQAPLKVSWLTTLLLPATLIHLCPITSHIHDFWGKWHGHLWGAVTLPPLLHQHSCHSYGDCLSLWFSCRLLELRVFLFLAAFPAICIDISNWKLWDDGVICTVLWIDLNCLPTFKN